MIITTLFNVDNIFGKYQFFNMVHNQHINIFTEHVLGTLVAATENHHTYAHRRRDKTFPVPTHPFTHEGR